MSATGVHNSGGSRVACRDDGRQPARYGAYAGGSISVDRDGSRVTADGVEDIQQVVRGARSSRAAGRETRMSAA